MSYQLTHNAYGKSQIRLVRVTRRAERHHLKDVTVSVRFEGDFDHVHVCGDNRLVLPTDTMKNTVYALAKTHGVDQIESFGLVLGDHFLTHNAQVSRVQIELVEHRWTPLKIADTPAGDAFMRPGGEARLATITKTRDHSDVRAGLQHLSVLKTARSGFEGYRKDLYTTLQETRDRILATIIDATWVYDSLDTPFALAWQNVRQVLLETFAEHDSLSVQHTLYAMAEAVLEARPEIREIHIRLPNRHHIPVDLSPFGLRNDNEVFVVTEEPYGLIEATVRRTGKSTKYE